jgi:hypothetical protein
MQMRGRHWVLLASLALACGNDEDVGGSGDPPTTNPPSDSTTSDGHDADDQRLGQRHADGGVTQSTSDDTTSDGTSTMVTPPDPLALECGEPPDGAVAATTSTSRRSRAATRATCSRRTGCRTG